MRYAALLLVLLLAGIGNAWGTDQAASSTKDISAITSSNWGTWTGGTPVIDENGFHISSPMGRQSTSNQSWIGFVDGSTGGTSWSAGTNAHSLGKSAYDNNNNNVNAIKLRSNRKMYFRVTGCTAVYALVLATSSQSSIISAYEYSGGSRAGSAAATSNTNSTSAAEISVTGLDASKTYEVEISASGTSDGCWFYEACFVPESSTGRYYDGTEKLYFLRDAFSWWKNDEVVFYAYFWNSTTNAWSAAAAWQVQTTSENKDVWAYTVPEGTWTGVQLTRHPKGTTTPTIGNRTNYSTDITIDPNKNLITDWTVYNGGDNAGHSNTWSNITIDNKKVYFDNRNYSTWTTAYVRMGHSSYSSAWGPMTKVAGTKYLYEQETDQWDFHTDFTIADSYGWTNSNNIYQPWENQSWSAPAKITKQTNYQKYGVARDYYLCPTSTSMLERECQYYNVNGTTFTTTTIDNTSTGTLLPQYEVTASGTNCTVSLVEYTADDFSTSTSISSGDKVDPTRYVGVTVTPSTGYQFSSISLTENAYEQHTAAAGGVVGKYAIMADCEISASCTPCTYNITYLDGGASDNITFTGNHMPSAPTTHTYNTATTLQKASKAGYVFGGWYDNYSCTGAAITSVGATAKTADFKLYAKWTAVSLTALANNTLYTATDIAPDGLTVSSTEYYYPGVSANNRFNGLGTGSSDADSGPVGFKTANNTVDGTAFTNYLDFSKSASVSSYIPTNHAIQFVIPAAGKLEIWCTTTIYLSNGSSETSIGSAHTMVDVAAGTYYLYAKNGGKKLYGIKFKPTFAVSAVTSTGDNSKGSVSAGASRLLQGGTTTITASPATGYQVTNWGVSGTGSTISPSGSSNSNTTTLTMGTADATVTVTFGAINYSVTYSSPSNGDYTIKVGDGSATSATKTANYGNTITLAATPAEGYSFSAWTITNTSTSADVTNSVSLSDANDKDATFTMPAYGVTVTATFAAACSAPAAPTISGTTAYTYGGTISLTATCASGTDASTTYTWYKGSDWATASAASPVQAASTSGATFSKTAEMADAGTYWCEAANSTCTAHNSSGYAITVAKADISPSLSYSSTSLITGDNSSSPTVTGNSGSGSVSYAVTASDPSGCITVVSGTGVVTAVAAGTGTVTATIAATDNYLGGTATATFTVTDPCFYANDLKKSGGSDIADDAYITASLLASGTITGGTLQNTSGGTLGHNKDYGLVMESGKQVTLTLTSPKIFEAGTVITVKSYSSNQGASDKTDYNKYSGIIVGTHKLADSVKCTSNAPALFTQTYTVTTSDGIEGGNSVVFKRTTAKTYIYSIKVTGCGERSGYTVTYDDNGSTSGSVPVDGDSPYDEDATVTVLGNTNSLAKNGYTFAGWNSKADGTGADFAAAGTFTITKDTVLYAQWTPNTYDITYNLNGASWAGGYSAPATYTVGTGATLPIAANMTNTGYTFGGWFANADLSTGGVKTAIGTSEYGNKEYWAKWTENEYDVTYNANGGSGDAMSATHGHYVTISDNSYTAPSGKIFVEWNTANDGSGASYNPGDEIELTANLPLYAIWAKAIGTINWSVTKVDDKLYRGGGGYSVTAEINDASWDASASDASKLELTATEGVVLRNVTTSINASGKAQIIANFDITTDVNANATKITFTLNVPENNGYAPIEDSHDENLTSCLGSSIIWDFTEKSAASLSNNVTYSYLAEDGETEMRYTAGSSCGIVKPKSGDSYLKENGASSSASAKDLDGSTAIGKNRLIRLFVSGTGTLSSTCYTGNEGVFNIYDMNAAHTAASGSALVSGYKGGKTTSLITTTNGLWIEATTKGYFYTITWTQSNGSVITPTLTWSGSLADDANVNKYDTDVDFTYTASQDKNSLGALTYSSSDETVATVNASGKVHILKAGTTTITANLAESGCYEEAEITYTLNVISTCTDVAGTLTAVDNGCDGVNLTVSGHTGEGVNTTAVRWYKNGVYQDDVAYNNKESITVTARSTASATRIVNQWYVKNGRRTPDIALVQTTNAVGFYVKVGDDKIWDEANSITTGFGGCDFYLGADGIIYLKGQTSTGAAPSDLTAGDVTLKITATGCGSNSSELSIVIHKQAATTAKSVAFVVDGTKGGAVTAFTASHATTSPLYVYLDSIGTAADARKFTLTGRNAYWSTVDSTLKAHYSQFDIILITDDPSTQTVPTGVTGKDAYKTKGYINALGTLIDIRPILSMEAFVSRLTNWGSKGIKGNPTSPNPRQYEMRLQCKDHEIYSGLPAPAPGTHVWSETIGGEEYRHVIMIDSTKSPYTGWAYNSKTDSLPALQGFTAEAMGDLLGLGVISNGTLQAGIERQEEPAARLLLLGVNAKALPNALTAEGKRVISNALTYLLKTNMEEVDDCSNYFTGKTSTDWNTVANWSKGSLPNYETKVRILAPCEVSGVTAHVAQVDIVSSGESSIRYAQVSDATCNGKLTINANGALIVEGKVRAAEAPHFATNDLKPTTVNDLVLNTSSANQAALIFNNDEGKTQATVNLYSLGRTVSETNQFQYFAIPMSYLSVNPTFANETHGITIYTYVWLEATGWERRGYYTDLYAFEGIGITTDKTTAHEYTMKGTLASTKDQEIPITAENKKLNLIGNSWTAPIQISELEASDFGDASSAVEQTVYIYCTGHGKATSGGETETAGQWLAIPFNATDFAAWEGLKVIPSMQSFQIKTTGAGTLTLDYKKHVRGGTTTLTEKLRAPKRKVETDGVELMRIRVADSQTHTDLYLFEGDQFTDEFDNGWEANYRVGTSESAKLYAKVATGVMSVAAMPSLESTPVYFIPGQETEYMFTFGGEGMGYYLNDIKMQRSTLISTEATYSFTYEKGDAAARFYISKTPIDAGDTPTGVSNTDATPKAQKIIYDNKLYIIVNGALYDATGKKVNSK